METLISGLAVLAVSGLTFVAYRHPQAYRRLQPALRIVISFLVCVGLAWDFGIMRAYSAILPLFPVDQMTAISKAIDPLKIGSVWMFVGVMAAYLYIEVIGFLPHMLGDEKPSYEKRRDRDDP